MTQLSNMKLNPFRRSCVSFSPRPNPHYQVSRCSQSFMIRMRMNNTWPLLLLATLFLRLSSILSSILITANITYDDSNSTVVPGQNYGGLAPPVGNQMGEYSCDCKRILLSSLGQAAQNQPYAMGIYEA